MRLTNRLNLPETIVEAVRNDDYSKGDSKYSITGLLRPPRISALEARYWGDLEQDVTDRLYSLYGQVIHGVLERADKKAVLEYGLFERVVRILDDVTNLSDLKSVARQIEAMVIAMFDVGGKTALAERRIFAEVSGIRISGKLDRFVYVDNNLQDYKFVSLYKFKEGLPKEFEEQLNAYVFLLRQNGYAVNHAEIVALYRDWHKGTAKRDPDYPQVGGEKFAVPLWGEEKTKAFLEERVRIHEEAKTELPACTPEDRWNDGDEWAVYKRGGKRAVRKYQSEGEALDHLKAFGSEGYEIQRRHGQNKRCEGYCAVNQFCTQWRDLQEEIK